MLFRSSVIKRITILGAGFGSWGSWGSCSKSCSYRDDAIKVRSRQCDTPSANYGGVPCTYCGWTCENDIALCDTQPPSCPSGEIFSYLNIVSDLEPIRFQYKSFNRYIHISAFVTFLLTSYLSALIIFSP